MAGLSLDEKLKYFIMGAGVGALLALLYAPKTGQQTRKLIAKKAEEGKDYLTSKGREVKEQAEDLVDKGKEFVSKQKERLAEVIETGKEAARSTISKV